MATEGNERNLRYILLLFEGGLLILRAILESKTKNEGKSLDELLQQQKRTLLGMVHQKHRKKLYPQTGNVDKNDWDISLLGTVILQLFNTSISVDTIKDIEKLKELRNKFAHQASISMDEYEYDDARKELAALLIKLSSGLDRDVHDKCQNFVKQFHTDRIDVSSATERLKEISKFDEKMEEQLTAITGQVRDVLVKCDRNHVAMQEIKQMLMELQKKSYNFVQEVGVKMDLRGPNDELTNVGETTIIRFFKLALKRTGVEKHFPYLTEKEILELTRVVDKILDGIVYNGGDVCDTEKQCIVIKIKCTSYQGLFKLLKYLESEEFKQGLLEIAEKLKEIFKCVYHITFGITQASLGTTLYSLRKISSPGEPTDRNGKNIHAGSDDYDGNVDFLV